MKKSGRGVRNFKGERQRNRNQQSERNFSCLGKRDRKSNRARCCLAMSRAAEICRRVEKRAAEMIRKKTGLALSPYFPASKLAWLKENVEGAEALAKETCAVFRNNRYLACIPDDTWNVL